MTTSNTHYMYNNLREKLDVMGYKQTLPVEAIPLVAALFNDLIKTTESLRDSKKKIIELLEEKTCWELGVEPYKCDNSRLLAQCNKLHTHVIKQQEQYEEQLNDLNSKIRKHQTDKLHLQQKCAEYERQLKLLQNKTNANVNVSAAAAAAVSSSSMKWPKTSTTITSATTTTTNITKCNKKPFISTVRSGDAMPPLTSIKCTSNSNTAPITAAAAAAATATAITTATATDVATSSHHHMKCTKCCACYSQRPIDGSMQIQTANLDQTRCLEQDLIKLKNTNKELMDHIKFYKQKIEARDREIIRLNDILSGGRSPVSLARECCYKNIDNLTEDLNVLQRDKNESVKRLREYQEQMHAAMQKALHLEKCNCQLQKQLDELKEAALTVETQANAEIADKEREVKELKQQLKEMQHKSTDVKDKTKKEKFEKDKEKAATDKMPVSTQMDKRHFNEKLNELTQKESELKCENERLQKKVTKLKSKLQAAQKEYHDLENRQSQHTDEEKIRIKSERDFFQKEYLRLLGKVGSEKEVEFLQTQIQSKDDELRILRTELYATKQQTQALVPMPCMPNNTDLQHIPTSSARSISSGASDCVQAAILRIERERDCARNDLQRIRGERDTLREKLLCTTKMYDEQLEKAQQRYNELNSRLQQVEKENRELNSVRQPTETQIIMLKEDLEAIKLDNCELREENQKLLHQYNNLKLLHEQTEKCFADHQKKLLLCEKQLEKAHTKYNTLDSRTEINKQENQQLHEEIAALKQTYISLECEKDTLLMQLDTKTEEACQLEYELKTYKEKRNQLEKQVQQLEEQLCKLKNQTRARDTELRETSTETKSLRSQVMALKASREQAMEENSRLSEELANYKSEIATLKKCLHESEKEIESLKAQLHQYVQEVKKAEDLLLQKEKEREEMLDHYRNLSHDAVTLEDNNQSLENEAAEQKRQIIELETEIMLLKQELNCRSNLINNFEDKIAEMQTRVTCLEHQIEEAHNDQCQLKTDLAVHKELCNKLDNEKEKLNAELKELNEIKQKLEIENATLREDLEKVKKNKKISSDTLEELLSKTRQNLEEQIKADGKLNEELIKLKKKNDNLLRELELERQKRQQNEALAREYQVQNQELRHNLTDEHFRQARSREQSPRFHAKTL